MPPRSLEKDAVMVIPHEIKNLTIGTGWESTPPARVDLDLAAYVFTHDHSLKVSNKNTLSPLPLPPLLFQTDKSVC